MPDDGTAVPVVAVPASTAPMRLPLAFVSTMHGVPLVPTQPEPPPPPPPPVPVGSPEPPAVLIVVVEVDVMQVTWVSPDIANANHPPFGAIYWLLLVADPPSAQYAPFVVPTFVATTSPVLVGNVPVAPPVVAVMGAPKATGRNPDIEKLPVIGSGFVALTYWQLYGALPACAADAGTSTQSHIGACAFAGDPSIHSATQSAPASASHRFMGVSDVGKGR